MKPEYVPGQWNAICDVCGQKFKSGELKKRWDGYMVCDKDFEFRNPQDLIKIPTDNPSVPWARPEPDPVYTNVTFRPFNDNDDVTPP